MRLFVAAALIAAFAVLGTAQNFPGNYVLGGSSVQVINDQGVFTTIFNNPGSAQGITMDIDNKHVIYGENTTQGWLRLDATAPGNPSTIIVDTNTFNFPTEVDVDQDGNYTVVASNQNFVYGIYKLDQSLAVTTITTTVQMGVAGTFTCGMVRDIDNGNLVLGMYSGTGPWPIVSVDLDTGAFTTVISNYTTLGAPRYQLTQDIRTGDFYLGGNDTNQGFLVRIPKNGASTIVATSTDRFAFNVLAADRASAANPRLVHSYIQNLYFTDLQTFTVTSVAVTGNSVSPRSMTIKDSRNIQTVAMSPRNWDVRYSFKQHAGKAFVAGITLGGVRPGIPLNDGRNILFNLDQIAVLSVQGLLAPFFSGNIGSLDTNGEAVGKLNLQTIPTLSLYAHIIAVVLDPQSPNGIAVISNPYVVKI